MGLDMYLQAGIYTSEYINKNLNLELRKFAPFLCENLGSIELKAGIGYWRKANQIHGWFVENIQNGEDNCQKYEVSRKQLRKLKDICEKILKGPKLIDGMVINGYTLKNGDSFQPNMERGKIVEDPTVALELLPPSKGFFFGSDYIDEFYMRDIKRTVEIIDRCLNLDENWTFHYYSSW